MPSVHPDRGGSTCTEPVGIRTPALQMYWIFDDTDVAMKRFLFESYRYAPRVTANDPRIETKRNFTEVQTSSFRGRELSASNTVNHDASGPVNRERQVKQRFGIPDYARNGKEKSRV
ncbi:hypothetical protein [Burkholderia plantarii]|uniref:hypothetical protein n=1 Tax=Burkholderia plantarii TaxID=41899 RepID=UPI0018DCECB7|nr:hypothetical protein [Burkholderia plantarii]MBI0330152.1 hypothetical protein [Burkholderia plantarii]